MTRRPKAVTLADPHMANAKWADDSRGKHGWLSEFFRWVIEKEVMLLLLGDIWELIGVGLKNEASLFESRPNIYTLGWLERALEYGRAENQEGGKGVLGNHDWWLSWKYMQRFRMQRSPFIIRFGDEVIWCEHGHAQEWETTDPSWTVRGARFAYWFETKFWLGADEAALKVWHWWQNWRRERRNKSENRFIEDHIPYWWLAVERKLDNPEITTFLHGHSHDGGVEILQTSAGPVRHVDADSWTMNPRGESRMSVAVYDPERDHDEPWRVLQVQELFAEYQ